MSNRLLNTLGLPPPGRRARESAPPRPAQSGVAASSSAGGPAASSGPDPDAFPASPAPVDRLEALTTQCDRHLRAQRFRATRQPEIVPGLPQFEFWLGDRIVNQDAIRTALVSADPGMSDYPIQLAHLVAERFDLEEKQVMMLDGTLPKATPATVAQPDGVLKRRADGQCYRLPAPHATKWPSPSTLQVGGVSRYLTSLNQSIRAQ